MTVTFGEPRRLQIGAVTYLNSKPLVEGLAELAAGADLRLDYPSRLADDLASGRLDVALIPSIEYFRGDGRYEVVSDACVAACGPVLSVKLYTRVPWNEIRTLALDEGSRTSATLARVLLAERFGVRPELLPLPLNRPVLESPADALVIIGDRAISSPEERFHDTWDLGEEWNRWTDLPFVFAMWVTRADCDLGPVEEALSRARDLGVERLEAIARREAPLLGLSLPTTIQYLRENLHFVLGEPERKGLQLFYQYASRLGLAPSGVDLVCRSCPSPR